MAKLDKAVAFATLDGRSIRLEARQGRSGLWYVTSPDVRWLLGTGLTLAQAIEAVPGAYAALRTAPVSGVR
ncbi:hypothetical protein [Salinarimonas soli]|uniref:Uncharacterized protein n=1 Tax=Salinarimonas soli TaxID=1638099 RepID=A0A5B2VTE1_9HYPH|nr:hypothetical protein [Salinarimonas soli]KAA2242295.1 hypothetical protein F0L46_03145 [Salinarimonas soli]